MERLLEWVWYSLLLGYGHKLAHGDVQTILGTLGALIVAYMWVMKNWGDKSVSDRWEAGVRRNVKHAKKEGWTQVTDLHARKLGHVDLDAKDLPEEPKQVEPNKPESTHWFMYVLGVVAIAFILLVFFLPTGS